MMDDKKLKQYSRYLLPSSPRMGKPPNAHIRKRVVNQGFPKWSLMSQSPVLKFLREYIANAPKFSIHSSNFLDTATIIVIGWYSGEARTGLGRLASEPQESAHRYRDSR